ncbi:leucine-rich repeat neuronal protein 4 [Xyrichtys novacula]|uniref:Leucine-rich repeat neuronal protein 4 n=1 Tax=Xyrichtys novacula TaxID=13765 RepID=A0AAV1FSY1_XYRNO|nr:leucine-rich repeat neuronal protein 4 [Xyrichtys novacula]
MAPHRDLPLLPVIVCLLFVRDSSSLPTTSYENPVRPLATDDYDQVSDVTTKVLKTLATPTKGTFKRCDYNPCLEGQVPCLILSASGCSCPGSTPYNEVPEPPALKSVSWNGSEVVATWCAPYSYVTKYVVTVGGKERLISGKDKRSSGLGDVDNVAQVCVMAANDSGRSKESCMMYQPQDSSLPLKAGLIGGALGFLLLLLLAVLLWRHRRQRKQEASISMHRTAETQ